MDKQLRLSVKERSRALRVVMTLFVTVGIIGIFNTFNASAETKPGGTDNGLTSRLVSLSDALSGLGYGSTTNSPDWGEHWNRISTAAQWVPSGDIEAEDVVSGKTFYNDSRTEQTGTYPAPGACETQIAVDTYPGVTQEDNCTAAIEWGVPVDSVEGDDKQDQRTGLVWSQALANDGGTLVFTTGSPSGFTQNASGANNVAVGGLTMHQLCSSMGNGWRLPTQKEWMQAYIDGSSFSLTNGTVDNWWTSTSYPGAWYVYMRAHGLVYLTTLVANYNVRCVRTGS